MSPSSHLIPGESIPSLTILAKSKAPDNILPITASCWTNIGQRTLSLDSHSDPDKLVLYSQLMQGLNPVLDAEAVATIISDDNSKEEIQLRDDGVAPDNVESDGVYSAYFTKFKVNAQESRHQVTCKLRGGESTTVVNLTDSQRAFPSMPSASTPICCGSSAVTEDTPRSLTGAFSRSRSGGVVKFGPVDSGNIYPPGPVRDLSLGNISAELLTFELSFTSPGAHLDEGTVKSFTIFYSTNKTELEWLDPASSLALHHVTPSDCHCNLQPQPPRDKVHLSLDFQTFSCDQKTFFRVLLINEANSMSLSNTAGIFLPNFPPGNISDLSLSNIQENQETFDLHFTTPGADFNKGTILEYKIFYSDDEDILSQLDVNSTIPFVDWNNLAVNSSLEAGPPTTLVNLTLDMKTFTRNQQTFFRVLVLDLGGKSSLSNVASFFIPNYPLGLTWGIAIAIFLGSMGATFLVVGAVFWHKWYYKW